MARNLLSALAWVEAGWPVFPLLDNGYLPRIPSPHAPDEQCRGECGRDGHGVHDATTIVSTVELWWSMWPNAGIGGQLTGKLVADLDPRNGADETWEHAIRSGRVWPETRQHRTKRGGRHYIFTATDEQATALNQKPLLGAGIDIKAGPGAYVVLPPTRGYLVTNDISPVPIPDEIVLLAQQVADASKPPVVALGEIRDPKFNGGSKGTGYGLSAMRSELAALDAEWTSNRGQFNYQLNKTTWNLARLVAGGELDTENTLEAIRDKCRDLGAPADQYRTLNSGWFSGIKKPRSAKRFTAQVTDHEFEGKKVEDFAQTHLDDARRLNDIYGKDLRHVPGWGWMHWTGRRWEQNDKIPHQKIASITDWVIEQAIGLERDEDKKKWFSWGMKSRHAAAMSAVVSVASNLAELHAGSGDFDSDPYKLLAGNGVINLKTGELSGFNRGDLLTRGTDVEYHPEDECPEWLGFLDWAFQGKQDMVDYVQKMFGLCLLGNNMHQVAFFLFGTPRSGKTTVINVLSDLLGDYVSAAELSVFRERDGASGHNDALASLAGARMVSFSETSAGQTVSESAFKRFTGQDTLSASFKGKSSFNFTPAFTPIMFGNYRPNIKFDRAVARRMKVIEMKASIADEDKDTKLSDRLAENEGGAILAWAVQGAIIAQALNDLGDPPSVRDAITEYKRENDHVGDFVMDCFKIDPNNRVTNKDLWYIYQTWVDGGGYDFAGKGAAASLSKALVAWGIDNNNELSVFRTKRGRGINGLSYSKS